MEKIKEFMSSPKKTAILGLVGSVIMLLTTFTTLYTSNIILNSYNLYIIGLIVYFSIVLMRMYKQRGNIKIANTLLIATYIISFILFLFLFYFAHAELNLIDIIFFGTIILYLCNILFEKLKIINNKVFAVIIIGFSVYQLVRFAIYFLDETDMYLISYSIKYIGYMAIVPYFYNYYELLKGGK